MAGDGTLRLVGGVDTRQGRVEIFVSEFDAWLPFCNGDAASTTFNQEAARIVCQTLFPGSAAVLEQPDKFGRATIPGYYYLWEPCPSTATSLSQCGTFRSANYAGTCQSHACVTCSTAGPPC